MKDDWDERYNKVCIGDEKLKLVFCKNKMCDNLIVLDMLCVFIMCNWLRFLLFFIMYNIKVFYDMVYSVIEVFF